VKVWPPMVRVAVRLPVLVLAATAYATVPLLLPLAPLVIVSQLWLLVALQAQPVRLVTLTEPVDAAAPTEALVGERL